MSVQIYQLILSFKHFWANFENICKLQKYLYFYCFQIKFSYDHSQTIIFEGKNHWKNMENYLLHFRSIWQQEKGLLSSADVSYQMVGLCDENKLLFSYAQYILLPFFKSKMLEIQKESHSSKRKFWTKLQSHSIGPWEDEQL